MRHIRRLLIMAFIESFATTCVERAVYFYSAQQLAFSKAQNLWLALGFGVLYVAGALLSHPLAKRFGEKRMLVTALLGQAVVHGAMAAWTGWPVLVTGTVLIGLLNGLKWPVVESYVHAGQGPAQQARTVGRFNFCWSSAVPTAMLVAWPVLDYWPTGLFILAGAINLAALAIIRPLSRRPAHIPHDHPDRPPMRTLPRLKALLVSSRWSMLTCYASMWVLAAIMPDIFKALSLSVAVGAALSGLLDAARVAAFVVLHRVSAWHNRRMPLVAAMTALPIGFCMVMFGGHLSVVLAGEVLFGLAAGMVYYAALYYGMVVSNASVDAGGAHEGLIGMGFALGPAAGLIGVALVPVFNSEIGGILCGVGPVFALCTAGGAWPLIKTLRLRHQNRLR